MNICTYSPIKNLLDTKGINERFKTAFHALCYLQATATSQGVYANNAAAILGNLKVGQIYNTVSGEIRIVV